MVLGIVLAALIGYAGTWVVLSIQDLRDENRWLNKRVTQLEKDTRVRVTDWNFK